MIALTSSDASAASLSLTNTTECRACRSADAASTVDPVDTGKQGVESVARKVVVELVDDIDGTVFGEDGESISYAVDGSST